MILCKIYEILYQYIKLYTLIWTEFLVLYIDWIVRSSVYMDKGFNGLTAKCQVQQKSHVWNKPSVPGFVASFDWADDKRFISSRANKIRNFNYDPCTPKGYFWWIGK